MIAVDEETIMKQQMLYDTFHFLARGLEGRCIAHGIYTSPSGTYCHDKMTTRMSSYHLHDIKEMKIKLLHRYYRYVVNDNRYVVDNDEGT